MYCNRCQEDNPVEWDEESQSFSCPNCGATLSTTRPKWTLEEFDANHSRNKNTPAETKEEPEISLKYFCEVCMSRKVIETFISMDGFHSRYWNLDLEVQPQHGEIPVGASICDMICTDCNNRLSKESEMLFMNERGD